MARQDEAPATSAAVGSAMRVIRSCACEGTRRTARALTQHYERSMAASGVRATQLPILLALSVRGAVPVTPLADALAIDRTTLTRNLTALVGLGLVSIADGPDRRVRIVSITARGRSVLDQSIAQWDEAQASVEERFGRVRLQRLLGELDALTERLRSP